MGKTGWIIGALIAVLALMMIGMFSEQPVTANVAVIPVKGVITTESASGLFADTTASSTDIVRYIEQANEDDQIEVILLEINSPGGSAVASDEIARAIEATDKPVVAWIRESGASGAYWIASEADWIIANRMSITGSVGVIASYLEFNEFLDRYNITYQQLTSGEYKDVGNPFAELDPYEKSLLEAKLDRIHEFFLTDVQQNRNLTEDEVRTIKTGIFFLGAEAHELHLVDQLGGREEVEAWLTNELGDEPLYYRYERQPGFFDGVFGAHSSVKVPRFTITS